MRVYLSPFVKLGIKNLTYTFGPVMGAGPREYEKKIGLNNEKSNYPNISII